jgi:hypothetical protein
MVGHLQEVTGQRTQLVHCEECGRDYAYELKRTGCGHEYSSLYDSDRIAKQKAEADLRLQLATGTEVIPCPVGVGISPA